MEVDDGLDLNNIGQISEAEVNANLAKVWSWRGPLYEMYANSLMLDYAPDFAKLHRWGSDFFGRPSHENIILLSSCNIHSYMMFGWETGILNEFITLRRNGMAKEQIMELVMFSQLYAGMRGPWPRLPRSRRNAARIRAARRATCAIPGGLGGRSRTPSAAASSSRPA